MATTTLMSFADFERQPPDRPHMEICRRLFRLLDNFVEGLRASGVPALGTVYFGMDYKMLGEPPRWLRPDISLTHAGQSGDYYFEGSPLIAFKIVSENDLAAALDLEIVEHLTKGSQEVWVIYPKTRHALVFGPGDSLRDESAAIRTDLLPGLDIPLDSILL